jgi:hypothetical protein
LQELEQWSLWTLYEVSQWKSGGVKLDYDYCSPHKKLMTWSSASSQFVLEFF